MTCRSFTGFSEKGSFARTMPPLLASLAMSSSTFYVGRGTDGPPLLLVHGFPLDHRIWRGQLDGLAGAARVVALDLPGCGETPPRGDGFTASTMDELADEVLALADALGFARFVLGGLSMGGYVALALARRHPGRLLGLALLDTRAEPDGEAKRVDRARDADDVLARGVTHQRDELPQGLLSPETLARRRDLVESLQAMI